MVTKRFVERNLDLSPIPPKETDLCLSRTNPELDSRYPN